MQTFSEFLNESTSSNKINPQQFKSIVLTVFGEIIKDKIVLNGSSGNQLTADVTAFEQLLSKEKNLSSILIKAAADNKITLVPTDGTDKNGFYNGESDNIFLKIKGNDYSDANKDFEETGELKYDLMLSLDTLEISA